MSWRIIYVTSHCHLSYKNGFVTFRGEEVKQIHISEIHTLIIDSNMVTISTYLLNELIESKIKVIICNEKHHPNMELMPYYGSFDSSKMISKEMIWKKEDCDKLWKYIIEFKIKHQAALLSNYNKEKSDQLIRYSNEVIDADETNREGHAAKVYFNSLFGKSFSRNDETNEINAYLNYGYSIILSAINKEVVANGYITQIGIHHKGANNPYNLSCDLMEIFRPIVDKYARENMGIPFEKNKKLEIVNILNNRFLYDNNMQYLTNIISIYVNKVLSNFENGVIEDKWFVYAWAQI